MPLEIPLLWQSTFLFTSFVTIHFLFHIINVLHNKKVGHLTSIDKNHCIYIYPSEFQFSSRCMYIFFILCNMFFLKQVGNYESKHILIVIKQNVYKLQNEISFIQFNYNFTSGHIKEMINIFNISIQFLAINLQWKSPY